MSRVVTDRNLLKRFWSCLLRILTGQGKDTGAMMPENPVLVARNIGPAELLAYGRKLRGVVLEEGSVGSHAAIVARALTIPLSRNLLIINRRISIQFFYF